MNRQRGVVVTAECVGCKKRREIRDGEIAPGDMPMCTICFMPMIAVRATLRPATKEPA